MSQDVLPLGWDELLYWDHAVGSFCAKCAAIWVKYDPQRDWVGCLLNQPFLLSVGTSCRRREPGQAYSYSLPLMLIGSLLVIDIFFFTLSMAI